MTAQKSIFALQNFENFSKLRSQTIKQIEQSKKNIDKLIKLSKNFKHQEIDEKYAKIHNNLEQAQRVLAWTFVLEDENKNEN